MGVTRVDGRMAGLWRGRYLDIAVRDELISHVSAGKVRSRGLKKLV